MSLIKFARGQKLCSAGEKAGNVFVLVSGSAVVRGDPPQEKPSGSVIGSEEFFARGEYRYDVYALEATVALVIDRKNLAEVARRYPDLTKRIMPQKPEGQEKAMNKLPTWLFPENHRQPDINAPESDQQFLYDKQVHCPLCGQSFVAQNIRHSRLRLEKIDPDTRPHYVGFEPLWYAVWVCPQCLYANLSHEYEEIGLAAQQQLQKALSQLEQTSFTYSKPRQMAEVLAAHLLAIYQHETASSEPGLLGALCLRTAWLYEDVDATDLGAKFRKKSLEKLVEAYLTDRQRTVEQEQRLCLLIGQLQLDQGNPQEALRFFRLAIRRDGGAASLNREAEDRVHSLRKSQRKKG